MTDKKFHITGVSDTVGYPDKNGATITGKQTMTDTISDEARTLVAEVLKASLYENISKGANPALVAQAALTAARNKALEDAAKCVEDFDHPCCEGGNLYADEIRAMKVQP